MRTRSLMIAAVLALAVGLGCSTTPKGPAPADRLQFLDSDMFDKQLSTTLGYGHPEVLVKFEGADVTVNKIPERLDRWLQSIGNRKNHSVSVLPDPDLPVGRGLETLAFSLVTGAYDMIKEARMYGPTKNYDATVYYRPGEGTLTRVVFVKKADASDASGEEGS